MEKLQAIKNRTGRSWDQLFTIFTDCQKRIDRLKEKLKEPALLELSSNDDLVVFGSFGRNECTKSSDIDWTLLIDGQANGFHFDIGQMISAQIAQFENKEPGFTGMFGQLTFSHDLVHHIGGQEDTNHNLSRRILMLLESDCIEIDNYPGETYHRVINGIIGQYIDNDSGYSLKNDGQTKVPRVLLNDVIRFWRTMCVDFAYKQRQQRGEKWALRNIKLRMSRKLIFVKGLLMCFDCYARGLNNKEDTKAHLENVVHKKPIPFIVEVLTENGIINESIAELIDAYERYLTIMGDDQTRNLWERTEMAELEKVDSFVEAKEVSRDFQNSLQSIFFEPGNALSEFTKKYVTF